MKIALLNPFTPAAAGVVEKSVTTYHNQPHLMALEMLTKEKGYDCSMEYFTPNLLGYAISNRVVKYRFFPVTFKFNGDHKKWKKQTSRSCLKAYERNTPDVSIIYMSGHSSPFSYELSKIILKKNKHYIAMLGGQHYSDNTINRHYYKNAHHILVLTSMQKTQMEKMELFKDKDIRVFPLGVNTDIFKPIEIKKKILNPRLLYVGRIVEWKRVHLAINVVKTLKENGFKEAHLNIIGPVSSETYQDNLNDLVKKHNLESNVTFLGHKEYGELPKYFQEADLFLLPSDKETFGMVMIEAMSCGTPVAGMDCPGGPADVITNGVNGILSNPQDYDLDILKYFKDENTYREMSMNARKKVLKEFSVQETYQVLRNSIESVMT